MSIPVSLQAIPRWITWRNVEGKKIPSVPINDPTKWRPFSEVHSPLSGKEGGLGFVLDVSDDIGGVDLDGCRNPETGVLTSWAMSVVRAFNSYTEVSPSGTGVKIFCKGAPTVISPNVLVMGATPPGGKTPQIEVYTSGRYFAVTGERLADFPEEVGYNPEAWLKIVTLIRDKANASDGKDRKPRREKSGQGSRNMLLASIAGAMRKRGMEYDAIYAALKIENEKRFDPPLPEREIEVITKSVCRYSPDDMSFTRNKNQEIIANSQDNIRTALERMGVKLRYDRFSDRALIQEGTQPEVALEDAIVNRLWLDIDQTFHFRPSVEFFKMVLPNECRKNPFHPVLDYLDALQWDGVKRLDTWLTTYAGAADNEYTRAVGKIVLVAAVRRARYPGCKFDEMLILESPQGTNKSTLISILAKEDNWFTDDLPLAADSKEVIERTAGKWIIEAAELSGMRKNETEALKAFLSRRAENARLAYERLTTERPRHFIVIGTTNSQYYLKDSTGNRRFWPVRVANIDLAKVKADRDQLWAEASALEKERFPIRLDPALYELAALQQERRRVDDPWEHTLAAALEGFVGRIQTTDIWLLLGIPVARRSQFDNERLGEVIKRLGWERLKVNMFHKGQKVNRYTYQKGTAEERKLWLRLDWDTEHNECSVAYCDPHGQPPEEDGLE